MCGTEVTQQLKVGWMIVTFGKLTQDEFYALTFYNTILTNNVSLSYISA